MSDKIEAAGGNIEQSPIRVGVGVPEIYVDGYQGAAYKDGVVKLNFFSLALDPASGATQKEVVLRMALSVGTVMQVQAALNGLLKDLEKAGVFSRPGA